MIDYNKLFDVAYSNTLSEDVKSLIYSNVLESIGEELNESLQIQQEDSCYVTLLNTLVNSTITEESLYNIIDMSFSGLSEEQIEEITEEFIRKAAIERLNEAAPAPIGLTGVAKENKKQQEAKTAKGNPIGLTGINRANTQASQSQPNQAPKAKGPSVMDRLKSAVGKVKSWVDKHKQPSGLDKLKATRDEKTRSAAEWGTSPSTKAEPKKTEVTPDTPAPAKGKLEIQVRRKPSGVEDYIGGKINSVKAARAEKKHETNKSVQKVLSAQKQAEEDIKKNEEALRDAEKDRKYEEMQAKKKASYASRAEKRKQTLEAKKKASSSDLNQAASTVAQNTQPEEQKELVHVRPRGGRKPKNANEALADFVLTLADTNISESALEEIVEMISNAKAAKKAVARDKEDYNNALKALDHAERNAILTKVPVNKEETSKLAQDAEAKGERYEKFKALAQKKYGIDCN